MKFLIILLLAIFPFGQLGRINLSGNEIVLHVNDLAVCLTLGYFAVKNRAKLGRIVRTNPLTKPLALFLATVVLSLVVNFSRFTWREMLIAILYPLRFFAYAGLFFVFWSASPGDKKLAKRWLLIGVVIVAIFGFLQYFLVPNVSFLAAQDWDDHYYRLVGSFLDPGFTGAVLALGLVLVFLEKRIAGKRLQLIRLGFIYTALALTYSRASYLLYLFSFAAISFYQKSLKVFLVAALILGITFFVLPTSTGEGTRLERENSVIARLRNWQESVQIWSRSPIFGVGFDTYRYVRNAGPNSHAGAGADSSVLLVLATTGILGLLAYLNLLRVMWTLGQKSLVFQASFLGIIVHSFFNNTLFYPWVLEWLWILLAITAIPAKLTQT